MKGAPASSQIIWLEDRVKTLEAYIERQRVELRVAEDRYMALLQEVASRRAMTTTPLVVVQR